MIRRTLILLSLVLPAALTAQERTDQCFTCHQALEDQPSQLYARDIHYAMGISCAGCHGGNPGAEEMEVAMDAQSGFIGVPKGDAISKTCERCHGDAGRMKAHGSKLPVTQAALLNESVHGRLSFTGKERLAQCTTCHNTHGIVSKRNRTSPVHPLNVAATCARCHSSATFMRNYNPSLPVDQMVKYRTSLHGTLNARGDANAAECASCHGSHDIRSAQDVKSKVYATNLPQTCASCHSDSVRMKPYKIPVDQYESFAKGVHGIALLEKKDFGAPACNDCHGNHGAVPPGVQSVSQVCGTCHALNAELFSRSPHKKAFDSLKLPECETCHGNHEIIAATDNLLGAQPPAVCAQCHTPEKSTAGYHAAKAMRAAVDSLVLTEEQAKILIDEAEQKGMEISEAKFKLREVRQSRLESRTTIHAFDEKRLQEVVRGGLVTAMTISQNAREAVDEYYFRRIGLGVSTLIITILAVSLFLFIRKIEKNRPG
ncbi:MAG TPA: cytochrome c3 family protein [Bacteroidota bacterium]